MDNTRIDLVLRRIAKELDISEDKRKKAVESYNSVGTYLSNHIKAQVDIFPQGSFRLGTVIKPLSDEDDYDIDDIILSEYGTTVVGLEMMRSVHEENAEENRKIQVVKSAFNTLSFSELEAIIHIFDEENRLFYDLERIWRDGKIMETNEFLSQN